MRDGHCRTWLRLLLVLSALTCAAPAGAAQVSAVWSSAANATSRNRAEALDKAFHAAVAIDALALLPGPLPAERQAALADFLGPLTGDYVQGYAELGTETRGEETQLNLDVRVDKPGLKRALQRLGTYYTVAGVREFTLRLAGGGAGAALADLGRLQAASGLKARDGADPVLLLEARGAGKWNAKLSSGGQTYESIAEPLNAAWMEVWGRYFARLHSQASAGSSSRLVLRVGGWFAPDAVQAFDKTVRSWEEVVESISLEAVLMQPTGVGGVWTVSAPNPAGLRARLDEYVAGKGLSYTLETGAAQ
jgi:hypothetical protein